MDSEKDEEGVEPMVGWLPLVRQRSQKVSIHRASSGKAASREPIHGSIVTTMCPNQSNLAAEVLLLVIVVLLLVGGKEMSFWPMSVLCPFAPGS